MNFLLVIPAFNESKRLPDYLEDLSKQISESNYRIEILIVDDGSSKTEQEFVVKTVLEKKQKYQFILSPLILNSNVGKGGAILAGWDYGSGYDYLCFVDADGSVPSKEVIRLVSLVEFDCLDTIIFASRVKMLGRYVRRSIKRHISGRIFSLFVGLMIDSRVYDSQCGFKLIPLKLYNTIRSKIKGRRFSYDVELVALAKHYDYNIIEVPIDWHDVSGSKVRIIRDSVKMFFSVLQIKKEMKSWM